MSELLSVAISNLLSPMVLFFALGFLAAMARSDLSIPEPIAKALSLYLMMAIGFKGGVSVAESGVDARLLLTALAGVLLSFLIPFLAYAILRAMGRISGVDAAAVAAHYGSISLVTFVSAAEFLRLIGMSYEGYLVAVLALMETPAIISGLLLARKHLNRDSAGGNAQGDLIREVLLNGSVVLLIGAFVVGMVTGTEGMKVMASFIDAPFKGVLCFFLLDMGLIAATRLRETRALNLPLVVFALVMPLIGAAIALPIGALLGLSVGGVALLAVLSASASYIAVPAAMRLALPEANPAVYLTLSLAVTFPFNLTIGIPLYLEAARLIAG
ncbi:MAG: sodium-dependent bicarbonate transport family permease [Alphaproteobacteria bacterium]|nr:sodium-dependent bicarbonate transport family permease [Alphaproteobacteria bacterium]